MPKPPQENKALLNESDSFRGYFLATESKQSSNTTKFTFNRSFSKKSKLPKVEDSEDLGRMTQTPCLTERGKFVPPDLLREIKNYNNKISSRPPTEEIIQILHEDHEILNDEEFLDNIFIMISSIIFRLRKFISNFL